MKHKLKLTSALIIGFVASAIGFSPSAYAAIPYNASYVLGQQDFTSVNQVVTQNGMKNAIGQAVDNVHHRIFVSDIFGDRVLVYDSTTLTNGMNASYVLGQPNFTSSTAATTQSGLNNPHGPGYDPTNNRLFVADYLNQRILIYDVSTITNGMNASYVLGQPNFTSSTAATTQSGLNHPSDTTYDVSANRLLVADFYNARVLIFDFAKLVSTVPSGQVGVIYDPVLGTNTQGTTTYAVTSGSLPPGLTLNTSTGDLTGTPTTAGSYTFTVSLSDDNGIAGTYTDSATYTVIISPAGIITTIKAPNTGFILNHSNPLAVLATTSTVAAVLIIVARQLKPRGR